MDNRVRRCESARRQSALALPLEVLALALNAAALATEQLRSKHVLRPTTTDTINAFQFTSDYGLSQDSQLSIGRFFVSFFYRELILR